mmetsp:Transcript_13633/g.24302  ORF Transcript_13633/g.24302 Transcript_13633/m.24302 type:complete len:184 (-) Transcript_13633:174-725(-)
MVADEEPESAAIMQLQLELASEQRCCRNLKEELKRYRELLLKNSIEAEAEEEAIINRFNKKLSQLVLEKERLAQEVEREEELITNTLQRQLNQLRKDKVELENQMEQEQECMVNKLQRQVAVLENQRQKVSQTLADEKQNERDFLSACLAKVNSAGNSSAEDTLADLRKLLEERHEELQSAES